MSFRELRQALAARLDEGNRGDRGWFLTTRVHLSPARLQLITTYLHDAGASEALALTQQHYRELAQVLGIQTSNPAQTINRHLFLAMETPLRLLQKVDPNRWDRVVLTSAGLRLATESNSVFIFEELLSQIRFCREPWYTASRVSEYDEFDVRPYPAILRLMQRNGGYVDIDEFDLFISRIRTQAEVSIASGAITAFRTLTEQQKTLLREEVAVRIPAGSGRDQRKPYSNWRDMARHSFSLFSLGRSAYRAGNELFLTEILAERAARPRGAGRVARLGMERAGTPGRQGVRAPTTLRIPDAVAPEDLLTPPSIPQGNSGMESELLIGKILAATGWQVVYYNQRRGYGFDLWAKKEDQAFVVEVKSFLGIASTIALTLLEHEAAQHHRDNFLLVIVENAASDAPVIHVIQNPLASINFIERSSAQFTAARSVWEDAATQGFPEGTD